MRARRFCQAAVVCLFIPAGCVAPARDLSDFRYKASLALDEAHSYFEAAALSVQLMDARDLPIAPIEVLTRDSEGSIGDIQSQFASVKPPSEEAQKLRTKVLDLLEQAAEPVEEARIALQSGDREGAVIAMSEAQGVGDQLKAAADELEP